jgi:hypothetical protein
VQQGCEHMLQNSRRIGRELGVDGNWALIHVQVEFF